MIAESPQPLKNYNPRMLPPSIDGCADYNPALANHILDRLSEGQSLKVLAVTNGGVAPNRVVTWAYSCQRFETEYNLARMIGAEVLIDEIPDIARSGQNVTRINAQIASNLKVAAFNNPRYRVAGYQDVVQRKHYKSATAKIGFWTESAGGQLRSVPSIDNRTS